MLLRLPSYYKEFSCIADCCKDSCCVGWEIDIDDETFAYYKELEGSFGDRLRANMTSGEENSFRLKKGRRCPFLNQRNLCDIVLNLGETSLCEICTEYPRFTLEYADVREKCLGISCEEVGRILFGLREPVTFEETEIREEEWLEEALFPEEEEPEADEGDSLLSEDDDFEPCETVTGEYAGEEYEENVELAFSLDYDEDEELRSRWLQKARDHAIRILQDREEALEKRICRCLLFAESVQERINEEDWEGIGGCIEGSGALTLPENSMSGYEERKRVLDGMEILDEEWRSASAHMDEIMTGASEQERREWIREFMAYYRNRDHEYEQLLVYFVFRYCMKSVFDYRFLGKVQLGVLSFLTIREMDMIRFRDQGGTFSAEDRIDNARIYSKEVEHSEDNLEYLAEEFDFTPEVHPLELCRQVLFG